MGHWPPCWEAGQSLYCSVLAQGDGHGDTTPVPACLLTPSRGGGGVPKLHDPRLSSAAQHTHCGHREGLP